MTEQQQAEGIGPGLVLLLAAACGATAANLYYAQPLLDTLAGAFGVPAGTAGLLVTVSQVGFVLGLGFLVPLGDLVERRRLIFLTMLCLAVGQGVESIAPGFAVFAAALLVIGVGAFVAQVVVPMSSHLAAEHERGKVVGAVMSGLLLGILLARTVSGAVATLFGWRVVFAMAGGVMLVLAITIRRVLPEVHPTSDLQYRPALRSIVGLIREEAVLRQRMLLGACGMGCFSILWTALSFLLSGVHGSQYHYSNATIGLFGLAGVAGAGAAQVAGRLADHGHGTAAMTGGLMAMLASWVLLALGAHSVIVLILGIVILDLGIQGTHISNQSAIYALRPEARSRLTTAYMVSYFLGGVILSAITSQLYAADGWDAVCVLGGATALIALSVWLVTSVALARGSAGRAAQERTGVV